MTGWVKLHRELIASPIFDDAKILKVFIWCLIRASHCHHRQLVGRQDVDLLPGQFIFGRRAASEELGITENVLRGCMKALVRLGAISLRPTNKFTIVNVVEWESYQAAGEATDSYATNRPPTDHQQTTTNKNGKRGKNILVPYPDTFERFWESYPRKDEKRAAFRCWEKLMKDGVDPTDLLDAALNYQQQVSEHGTAQNYVKLAKTFLNAKERPYEDCVNRGRQSNHIPSTQTVGAFKLREVL